MLPQYDAFGSCEEPDCGDVLEFNFNTQAEIVTEIGYSISAKACYPMKACSAALKELCMNKAVVETYLITKNEIADFLGGLDSNNMHCAMMAEIALKRALIEYSRKKSIQAQRI